MKVFDRSKIKSVNSTSFVEVKVIGNIHYVTLNIEVTLKDGTHKSLIRISTWKKQSRTVRMQSIDESIKLETVDYEE